MISSQEKRELQRLSINGGLDNWELFMYGKYMVTYSKCY